MSNVSPAYQWYPKDILSSARVAQMTAAEECFYRRALDYAWLNGGIPTDIYKLKLMLGKRCSTHDAKVVLAMFTVTNDPNIAVSPRQELERDKQRLWREKSVVGGRKSAEKRGKGGCNLVATKTQANDKGGSHLVATKTQHCSLQSSISSSYEEDNYSLLKKERGEPPPASAAPDQEIEASVSKPEPKTANVEKRVDKARTRPDLSEADWLNHLQELPENRGIDVPLLFKRMLAWCERNGKPSSRQRLLVWLDKDRADGPISPRRRGEPVTESSPIRRLKPRRPAVDCPPEQQAVWTAFTAAMRKRLGPNVYRTWFDSVIFDGFAENNALNVRATQVTIDWISRYYGEEMHDAFIEIGCGEFTLCWEAEIDEFEEVAGIEKEHNASIPTGPSLAVTKSEYLSLIHI